MSLAAPWHVHGQRLLLDPAGALIWPERRLLAVADLHLEKGSAAAAGGQLVPPLDTHATLERLAALLRRYRPDTLVLLGDSFHDRLGCQRMRPADAARLARLAAGLRTLWVLGNHDPEPPTHLPGIGVAEHAEAGLVFRHVPDSADPATPEICGHLHPKARIALRGTSITRPCFVADARRVLLPAFGTYTGGLDVTAPPIAGLFPRGGRVMLLGEKTVFGFAFAARRGCGSELTRAVPTA